MKKLSNKLAASVNKVKEQKSEIPAHRERAKSAAPQPKPASTGRAGRKPAPKREDEGSSLHPQRIWPD